MESEAVLIKFSFVGVKIFSARSCLDIEKNYLKRKIACVFFVIRRADLVLGIDLLQCCCVLW